MHAVTAAPRFRFLQLSSRLLLLLILVHRKSDVLTLSNRSLVSGDHRIPQMETTANDVCRHYSLEPKNSLRQRTLSSITPHTGTIEDTAGRHGRRNETDWRLLPVGHFIGQEDRPADRQPAGQIYRHYNPPNDSHPLLERNDHPRRQATLLSVI